MTIEIASPLAGWVTPLDEVPDPVFAERMLGDGAAIDPVEGRIVAPGTGVVSSVHESGHAVTIELDSGPVLLIHIGLDTVGLGGEGFLTAVRDGDRVTAGQTLIRFDLDLLARRTRSLVTPIIVTNGAAFRVTSSAPVGPAGIGDPLLTVEPVGVGSEAAPIHPPKVSRTLRLLLAYGLHARPAARIAKLAGDFDAEILLVAEDGRTAPARSPVTILGLGLTHGAAVTLRGGGPQAEEAVAAMAELLESGMGELQPLGEAPGMHPVETTTSRRELRGIVAVPGMAIGPAWWMRHDEIPVQEEGSGTGREREALAAARTRVAAALDAESRGGHGGDIAAAHLAMVGDPALAEMAERLIDSGKSAAFAWREAIRRLAAPLRASTDARFAQRLDDLIDLERRLLAELDGEAKPPPAPAKGAILLADTLYPSQLAALGEAGILAIATATGSATSHVAIIAGGMGLPMLAGLGEALEGVADGAPLILRGDTLIVASDPSELEQARQDAAKRRVRREAAAARAHEPATTVDGARIEVFANLGSVAEARVAVEQGAEGCGLLRTEFLFLGRDSPPGEAEQRDAYQQIADALGERPLIVRTLDIGADKPAPWLPLDREDNPALGLRGIRLQLARADLLETQLRAFLAVQPKGPLKIMLPMVTGVAEIRAARAVLDRLASALNVSAPELGAMIETPAAALLAASLAQEAAFFSVGTNDLSQYVLARDRTNPAVSGGLDALDPAILRLIDQTVRGATVHGRVTGVCGGLAALPEAVPILIGLGVTELSVPATAVAETKAIVRSLEGEGCRALAAEALGAQDAATVRALVAPLLEQVA